MATMTRYSFGTRVAGSVADVRPRVEAALKAEGFGILTEIDVQAVHRAKLGVERAPYVILGACNPGLSNQAIDAEPSIGALLPCNVVLREDGSDTIVELMDPVAVMSLVDRPEVAELATEVRGRLERVVDSLG